MGRSVSTMGSDTRNVDGTLVDWSRVLLNQGREFNPAHRGTRETPRTLRCVVGIRGTATLAILGGYDIIARSWGAGGGDDDDHGLTMFPIEKRFR